MSMTHPRPRKYQPVHRHPVRRRLRRAGRLHAACGLLDEQASIFRTDVIFIPLLISRRKDGNQNRLHLLHLIIIIEHDHAARQKRQGQRAAGSAQQIDLAALFLKPRSCGPASYF